MNCGRARIFIAERLIEFSRGFQPTDIVRQNIRVASAMVESKFITPLTRHCPG